MGNQSLVGYRNKYAYVSKMRNQGTTDQRALDNGYYQEVVKIDLEEGKVVQTKQFGENINAGETFYYQKDSCDHKEFGEDHSYLFNCGHDWKTDKCNLLMYD